MAGARLGGCPGVESGSCVAKRRWGFLLCGQDEENGIRFRSRSRRFVPEMMGMSSVGGGCGTVSRSFSGSYTIRNRVGGWMG
jgi:hypothetical protein